RPRLCICGKCQYATFGGRGIHSCKTGRPQKIRSISTVKNLHSGESMTFVAQKLYMDATLRGRVCPAAERSDGSERFCNRRTSLPAGQLCQGSALLVGG